MATQSADELTRVSLDHALYGYRRGHELLATSTELRPESRSALLVLTDMSGPSLVPGFESYLTGIPLPADDIYALARTWYAPEMRRPGCVWTHVLLLKRDIIAQIQNLADLRALFHRPQTADLELLEFYARPVSLGNQGARETESLPINTMAGLLDTFYSSMLPLMIPSSRPSEYEALVLALWSHLGPRARFAFTFCTGSMSIRKFKGENLVFQVIAPEVRRQVERAPAEGRVVEMSDAEAWPNWIQKLAQEIVQQTPGRMQELIHSFDLDIRYRHVMPLIAPILADNNQRTPKESIYRLIKAMGDAWPSPKDGEAVKQTLVGNTEVISRVVQSDISEAQLLDALSLCSNPSAFDFGALHLRERARDLWVKEGRSARDLALKLLNGEGNELGDEVLSGLMEAMPDSELWGLAERNSALVLALLRRDAALAQSPRLWKLPRIRGADVLDAVERSSPNSVATVARAVLEAGRFDVALQMVERYGSTVAIAALDWLAKSEDLPDDLPLDFIKSLGRHHEIVLSMLRQHTLRSEAVSLLLFALGPEQIDQLPIDLLADASKGAGRFSGTIGPEVGAALLARGLKTPEGGEKLVASTFASVHHALSESRLSYPAWRPLDRILPTLSWRDWDKCERLRRGFIEAIEANRWAANLLFQAAKDDATFRLMLKTCRSSSDRRAFLRRALKESPSNAISAVQKRILKSEEDID